MGMLVASTHTHIFVNKKANKNKAYYGFSPLTIRCRIQCLGNVGVALGAEQLSDTVFGTVLLARDSSLMAGTGTEVVRSHASNCRDEFLNSQCARDIQKGSSLYLKASLLFF